MNNDLTFQHINKDIRQKCAEAKGVCLKDECKEIERTNLNGN